jgi:hypothetical protein
MSGIEHLWDMIETMKTSYRRGGTFGGFYLMTLINELTGIYGEIFEEEMELVERSSTGGLPFSTDGQPISEPTSDDAM